MHNSVTNEINVLLSCFALGIICGMIFDIFKAFRYGKNVNIWFLIIQDIVYYFTVSCVAFNFIFKINGAEIRGYMICAVVLAFLIYRLTLSKYFVRVFIWVFKIVKCLTKIVLFPIVALCKIIVFPFLKIKQKLLSKKAKIALTIKEFCFKIKCNVGMIWISNKICKERKPCRRKQKPEKRV